MGHTDITAFSKDSASSTGMPGAPGPSQLMMLFHPVVSSIRPVHKIQTSG